MLKCKICGTEFPPIKTEHYISRDNGRTGIQAIVANDEKALYDTFDCPMCGCQMIAQERKRQVFQERINFEEDGSER